MYCVLEDIVSSFLLHTRKNALSEVMNGRMMVTGGISRNMTIEMMDPVNGTEWRIADTKLKVPVEEHGCSARDGTS